MNKFYYTIQEIQTLKVYELPNTIYNAIMDAITSVLGCMTDKIKSIINRAYVYQLDQYINVYQYIHII